MKVGVRRIAVLAVVTASLLAVPSSQAADGVVSWSNKGVVAFGVVRDERGTFPRTFQVQLVVPDGTVVTSGGLAGVDLSRAWAVVLSDSADGNGHCSGIANPSRFSAGREKNGRWTGTSVDVACDDGAGYDFYRFTWSSAWQLSTDPLITTKTGGQPIRFWTDAVNGLTQARPDVEQQGVVTACGYRGDRPPECLEPGQGLVVVAATGVTTTATSS